MSASDSKPEGFDELVESIHTSQKEDGNNEIQEIVLRKCIRYLINNQKNHHWFCDPYMFPMATQALILFSFKGSELLEKLKPFMKSSLGQCELCVRHFNQAKSHLREMFATVRGIPMNQVNQFLSIIIEWETQRIVEIFDPFLTEITQGKKPEVTWAVKNGFNSCLMGPAILRNSSTTRMKFVNIANYLFSKNELTPATQLYPGLIYLSFEGTSELKHFAERSIKGLQESAIIYNKRTLDIPVVEEFSIHLYKIQDAKYFSEHASVKFWSVLYNLLDLVDNEAFVDLMNTPKDITAMSELTNIRLYPIVRVFFNNIMSFLKEPLPILLLVFNKFTSKFKDEFWSLSAPFTYMNVLDNVLANPEFGRLLISLPVEKNDSSLWVFTDVTIWMNTMLESLNESQKQAGSVRLGTFLLKLANFKLTEKDETRAIKTRDLACNILLGTFEFEGSTNNFRTRNFSIDLLRRREVRATIEYHADEIVDLAVHSNLGASIKLISESIQHDIALLAHNTFLLLAGTEPTSYDTFPLLWQSLVKKPVYNNKDLTNEILKAMKNVSCAIDFVQKKNEEVSKQLADARNQHNKNVALILKLLEGLLEKISLADPSILKDIFGDVDGLTAYWSCIFSPAVNQGALDILYQVFDVGVGGRFETIKEVLSYHLKPTLVAININLQNLIIMEAYEPCPKAIRILMDVINALCDPLGGVLAVSTQVADCSLEIEKLWGKCWKLLIMVYQKTLVWAGQYHLTDLVEFTRDTLDLSHLLIDSFRRILDHLQTSSNDILHALFKFFMEAFHFVVVWLRLGDTSLLNSCVDLVFKGLDLASDLKFTIDRDFIETFAKYGAKAKRFNNKLSDVQRLQILAKAREFDEALVENIITETQLLRSKSRKEPSSDGTPEAPSYRYQTHQKAPKQQTLGRYGVVSSEAPVAPAPKEFKSSGLDAIRKELKNARAPISKPAVPLVAPAAPRPAGYNSKRAPAVGRSLNGLKKKRNESDSSDDDDNVDFSDLFIDKKQKAKVVEVDINGRPIVKLTQDAKLSLARKEEENMRARLNVNLKPLYSIILKWNYNSSDVYPSGNSDSYKATKNTYDDVKDYVKTTEPLLMLECWQGIQSSKQTGQEQAFDLLIGSRTSVDGFFDVYASVRKTVLAERKVGDSDLLVLGFVDKNPNSSPKELARYLKAPTTRTCFAKVREIKSANSDFSDVTLRVYPGGSMMGVLTPKSEIIGMKIMQMVTVEREFTSLKGLQYYDLCESIILATPNVPQEISEGDAKDMMKLYEVNKSQARAIAGSYNNEGFSLIQGPPGTGKTKTILGIVGYSLSQQVKDDSLGIPTDDKASSLSKSKAKILICAPSNAAVDELVVRLRGGVRNSKGQVMPLKVVRLGRSDAINASVRDLTLEELVDKELQTKSADMATDPTIRTEHTKCISERDRIREQLKSSDLSGEKMMALEDELRVVNKKRNELAKKLDEQRERVSIAYRTREIDRRFLQAKILSDAQVICSTLSGSAHDFLSKLSIKFDQVIIDEACQCVELSAIIPLRYGCKKCIMVGDPNQLPPTVLSQTAASLNYEQSLFVRMQNNNPKSVYLLDVQYRMHPDISRFPSAEFYQSQLLDGPNMLVLNKRPWHDDYPLSPYRFFDIVSKHQRNELSKSLFNPGEARVALELVEKLMQILPEGDFSGRIGIISPYKEQIRTLKDVFSRKYGRMILNEIDFNTVDGFQGQEKEIIIMSCVRASETGNVGFLSDIRRMNVALTRSRASLWILGNKSSLMRNKVWNRLLENATQRDCVTVAYPGFLNKIYKSNNGQKRAPNDSVKPPAKRPKNPEPLPYVTTYIPLGNSRENSRESGESLREPSREPSRDPPKESKESKELSPPSQNISPPSNQISPPQPPSTKIEPIVPTKSGIFPVAKPDPVSHKNPRHKNAPYVYKAGIPPKPSPSNSGVHPRITSDSANDSRDITPTSTGTIKPPPKKAGGSSIFINNRRRPPPKK